MERVRPEVQLCKWLSLAELAHRWRVHIRTVRRWIKNPEPGRPPLQAVRIGRKNLYPLKVVEAWEAESRTGPSQAFQATATHSPEKKASKKGA